MKTLQAETRNRLAAAQRQGKTNSRPSVQFAKEQLSAIAAMKTKTRQSFQRERAAVAKESRRFKLEGGHTLLTIYEPGLKQLAVFRPLLVPKTSDGGFEPIPQQNTPTDAQRRLTDLARRFIQEGSGQKPVPRQGPKRSELAQQKEWEPEP